MQLQVGDLAAPRMHGDIDVAHFAAGNLPGKREAVGEAVLDPICAKLRRQIKLERAVRLVDFPPPEWA